MLKCVPNKKKTFLIIRLERMKQCTCELHLATVGVVETNKQYFSRNFQRQKYMSLLKNKLKFSSYNDSNNDISSTIRSEISENNDTTIDSLKNKTDSFAYTRDNAYCEVNNRLYEPGEEIIRDENVCMFLKCHRHFLRPPVVLYAKIEDCLCKSKYE